MGYNGERSTRFIVDLETAPIADAASYLDLAEIQAPATYKKEEAIAGYIAAEKAKQISKAALDLDLCRIVALGWWAEDERDPCVLVAQTEDLERTALEAFWSDLDGRSTIGFNQVQFDLPILLRRSLYLDVDAPGLNLDKYRTNHQDLQQKLSLNGTKPYRSLNWYCKRLKLDVPCDASSGKDIGALVEAEDWASVADHCRIDLLKTRALAARMGLLKRDVPVEAVL